MKNAHTLIAIFNAIQGKEEELKAALSELVSCNAKENGCIYFNLHESSTQNGQFMIYEIWATKEAHNKHDSSAHVMNWRKIKHNLVNGPTQISSWLNI